MDENQLARGARAESGDNVFWLRRAVGVVQEHNGNELQSLPFRHGLRRRIELDVLINCGFTYSTPWRVRDLSPTGAFIETKARLLPEGAIVEAVLRYDRYGRAMEMRIPAAVTRVEADGVGLTFGYYDDQMYTDLVNLLYATA